MALNMCFGSNLCEGVYRDDAHELLRKSIPLKVATDYSCQNILIRPLGTQDVVHGEKFCQVIALLSLYAT